MRYFGSQYNFRAHQPAQKKWWHFFKRKNKKNFPSPNALGGRNPFKKEVVKKRINLKKFLLPSLVVIWLSLMIYLPYFRIKNITYDGLKIIKQDEMGDSITKNFLQKKWLWPANNYFLLNENSIAEYLQKTFSLNAVKVKKIFPDRLHVELEEKILTFVYDDGHKYFLVDQDGAVIKFLKNATDENSILPPQTMPSSTTPTLNIQLVSDAENNSATSTITTSTAPVHIPNYVGLKKDLGDYPIIYNLSATTTGEREINILNPSVIKSALTVYNSLRQSGVVKIKYFTVDDNPKAGIAAYTDKPWKILFQPFNNIEKQLNNLRIILANNQPTEYIDLRFGERVYWK